MSKINRYDGDFPAFGENFQSGERTAFGTEDIGQDDLTENMNQSWQRGWGIISPSEFPPIQYFNAVGFTLSRVLEYLHQMGVAEWNVDQKFYTGSFTQKGGSLWASQSGTDGSPNVGNDPETDDGTNWVKVPNANEVENSPSVPQSVDSVATLRASSFPANLERLWLSGYFNEGVSGGDLYRKGSGYTSSDDNGETFFVDGDGVGWGLQSSLLSRESKAYRRQTVGVIQQSHGGNRAVYAQQRIDSYGNRQYCIFWNKQDQLTVGARDLPNGDWSLFSFDGNDGRDLIEIGGKDPHYIATLGIDPNGVIVICYNTRNSAILWRYSAAPEDITAWSAEQNGMTGANESSAGYPSFVYGENRKLLFMYRDGVSGEGDVHLNEWDESGQSWSAKQHPLIRGADTSPTTNPYFWNLPIVENGDMHVFWCWRETGSVETNFNLNYAVSRDSGATWEKSDGTAYTLPINQSNAEVIEPISQNSGLINQGTSAVTPGGIPVVSYIKYDSAGVSQIFTAQNPDGNGWEVEQVSSREEAYDVSRGGTQGTPLSRPGTIVFKDGTICILAHDQEYGGGIMRYSKLGAGLWQSQHILTENLINYEPVYDQRRFYNENVFDLLAAPVPATDVGNVLQHEVPYDLISFESPQWLLTTRSPIEPMQIVMSTSASDFSTTATKDSPESIDESKAAFSMAAFPRYPQFVRVISECEHDTAGSLVGVGVRFTQIEGPGGPFNQIDMAEKRTDADARQMVDSGWRRMPYFSERSLDFGFFRAYAYSTGGGTATVRTVTVLLGSKQDAGHEEHITVIE